MRPSVRQVEVDTPYGRVVVKLSCSEGLLSGPCPNPVGARDGSSNARATCGGPCGRVGGCSELLTDAIRGEVVE